MHKHEVRVFTIIFFLIVPALLFSDALPGPTVSAEWLNRHLDDRDIRIIDVSFDKESFLSGHVPNAVFLDWRGDLADPDEKHYSVLAREDFERLMRRIGVTRDTQLVFYDDFNNRLAIRALWVAEFYGHAGTAILEGGIRAWKARGYRTTGNSPEFPGTRYTVKDVHEGLNVDKDYVLNNLVNPNVMFVDGRSAGMYIGFIAGREIHTGETIARSGHLPGAVNQPWKDHMDSQSKFLDKTALETMYTNRGINRDLDAVVFYCNEGVHAAFDWFVAAKILGYENAKIYDGSMSEWAEDANLPLKIGLD